MWSQASFLFNGFASSFEFTNASSIAAFDNISAAAVLPLSLPDEDPEWKFAGRAYPSWDACIVALKAEDGTIGYGYAAAFTHLGATNAGVEAALHRLLPLPQVFRPPRQRTAWQLCGVRRIRIESHRSRPHDGA